MNDTTRQQIHRQSCLKVAAEWFKTRPDYKPTLQELIGVSMGLEAYVQDGSYDLLQTIQRKLDNNLDNSQ